MKAEHGIGMGAALLAVSMPDVMSWITKLVFAVVTAMISSYVSGVVRRFMDRKGSK